MSVQPLIFKNGFYTLPRSAADIEALKVTLGISTSNFVDVSSNQTIDGVKLFSGSLRLPNNAGTVAGTIWRSGDNLEYKDGANVTKILLNSAGNLSNLINKQTALNNLVNGQVANRVLRSDGTNVTLSQVNLTSDVINNLPIANGGTGSSTQNFVDLTTNQSIGGIKTFSNGIILPSTSGTSIGTIWRNVDNLEYKDGSNVTKVILNSAGNLSNLANKQASLNNLVGTQIANRVLRSDGTNVTLSQVALDTDVINTLPISSGGTGSSTQNFVDLTTSQSIAGVKVFSDPTESTNTTTGGTRCLGGFAVTKNLSVGGRIIQAINHTFKAAASTTQAIPANTWTKITLNSEVNDSNNQYTPATSRLTAVTTEVWQISTYITFRASSNSRLLFSIWKNGAEVGGTSRLLDQVLKPVGTEDFAQTLYLPEFPLIAGDFLEVYCNSSSAITIFGEGSLIACSWSGKRIN